MPALLFLCITTLAGLLICSRLSCLRGIAERTSVSLAVALILQLWIPFITSRFWGIRFGPLLACLLCGGGCAWLLAHLKKRGGLPRIEFLTGKINVLLKNRATRWHLIFLGIVSLFFGWQFYTHSLQPTAEGLSSAGVAWEDQSFHTMLASSFLYSENLKTLQYPHFVGWPLGYPFLPDLLASTLTRLGATLSEAFWWSGWYAACTFLLVAWTLARQWLGNGTRACVAISLYLTAGGLGFLDFFQELRRVQPWSGALMLHDYVNGWELNLHYHNPVTGILLPMRTSLFGMPIALAVLLVLTCAIRRHERRIGIEKREWLVMGLLTGLLPLIHAHSFVVVGLAALFYGISWRRQIAWKHVLWTIVPALILALPQILWTRGQLAQSDPPFLRWHLGWMCDAKTIGGWLGYWLHNGGLRLPLGMVAWFFAPRLLKQSTAPLLALLLIGNFMVFQPFVYDNIKLFTYTDLALAALCVLPLASFWQRNKIAGAATVGLFIVLGLSGLLSIWRETRLHSLIVSWEDATFAEVVKANSSPRDIFLTGSQLTHPVPVLTGRPLVLGYVGGLRLHGVVTGERERDVIDLYSGKENALSLIEKYHIRYAVIGPAERREFPQLQEDFFANHSRMTLTSGQYTLYDMVVPERDAKSLQP